MATPGGVDSSFTETLDKQGMSEQDLDCQGKQILYVGDSVGHTANLKYIESSMRCHLESLRAYSSVMDQNARWLKTSELINCVSDLTLYSTQWLLNPKIILTFL